MPDVHVNPITRPNALAFKISSKTWRKAKTEFRNKLERNGTITRRAVELIGAQWERDGARRQLRASHCALGLRAVHNGQVAVNKLVKYKSHRENFQYKYKFNNNLTWQIILILTSQDFLVPLLRLTPKTLFWLTFNFLNAKYSICT